MTVESVVEKFANSRPGYRLSDFAECGLPVFWLTVRALVSEKKDLPPIEEACMRAIEGGLCVPGEVGEFLGLSEGLTNTVLGTLHSEEHINYVQSAGKANSQLTLTGKGRQVLHAAVSIRPQERILHFGFDGLLFRPILVEKAYLVRPKEARDLGLREIPFLPPRRPELPDLSIEDIDKIIQKAGGGRGDLQELLAITSIESRDLFFMSAVMLIFRSNSTTEVQVSFVLDGRSSDDRAHAFASKDGLKLQGIKGRRPQKEVDIAKDFGVADLSESIEQTDQAQQSVIDAEENAERIRQSLSETSEGGRRDAEEKRLVAAEHKVEEARSALREMTQRWLYCADHPPLLRRALTETKTRLLLISPWIRDSVVDIPFCGALEELLKQGVDVYIGYGLVDGGPKASKEKPPITFAAKERLESLQSKYPKFRLKLLGDTHAKILLSDTAFAISGSFNWLSFKGDPNKKFRDEQGFLVSNPTLVEQKFQDQVKLFSTS